MLKIFLLLVLAVVVYFAVTLVQVWLTSRHYEARPAQAIVVMGAAQYDGVPSPDLRARLDEAVLLFHQGDAGVVAVTGSKEKGDEFTEAEAGARYLETKGVPSTVIVEAGGDDTWQSLSDVAPMLKARGDTKVLMVTDPFHEDRSMAIASGLGLTPYPTPTQTSPITGWATVPYFLKEAVGVGLGRVVGYQHLHALG
ncbi:MAG TPA: YdcF family protein [Acidimicrobiales bacterium]|nr:YdcF family protein [Acidimicrobiales bacterium]